MLQAKLVHCKCSNSFVVGEGVSEEGRSPFGSSTGQSKCQRRVVRTSNRYRKSLPNRVTAKMKSAVNFHFVASWKNCLVVWLWCRCVVPPGRLVSSSVFCVRGETARRIFTGSPRLRSSQASPASVYAASLCSQPHGRIGFGCLLEEICEAARTTLKIVFPI